MPLTKVGAATLLAVSFVCGAASAQTFPWDEYKKRLQSAQEVGALKSDLFGDQVNLSNGALSFSATDVALPGNGPLAVAFTRTYSVENQYERVTDRMLADWDLDVPHISATFAPDWASNIPGQPWKRCSAPANQAMPPSPVWDLPYYEFWQGNQMSVPGGAGGELLRIPSGALSPSTGGPYHWMTTSQTYVSCLTSIKNQAGAEGFLAITADGTRYWFDWLAQNFEPNLSSPVGGSYIQRRRNVLYATKVEDRFGNVVEYQYVNLNGSWNSPARLVSVSSSDGRTLSVTRNASGHIASVSDGSRTWTYEYAGYGHRRSLSAVVLPDTRRWQINFGAFTTPEVRYPIGHQLEPTRDCFIRFTAPIGPTQLTGTITHPSGALGTFDVAWMTHGRSNVPIACTNFDWGPGGSNTNDDVNLWTISYEAYSIVRKQISGVGVQTGEWTYSYTPNISFDFYPGGTMTAPCPLGGNCGEPYCTSDACARSAETTILGPNGKRTKYFHGNSFRYNEGKLLRVEEGTVADPLMKVQTYTYDLSQAQQAYPARFGISIREDSGQFVSEYHRPQLSMTTQQQGVLFKWEVETGCGAGSHCFDPRARPIRVRKSSSAAP